MTVPDVVGLDVDVARQVASDAGLTLAQPDGRRAASRRTDLGEGVRRRDPAAAAGDADLAPRLARHHWLRPGGGDTAGVREPRRPGPHQLDAEAAPPPPG